MFDENVNFGPMADSSSATYQIYATLPMQIAAQIGRAIVDGEFQSGQKLREVDLAQSFGVSRASVREALRLVESEGLVTILPQRGAQVTALSVEELQDIFDIRAALVGLVSQRLAMKASPQVRKRLGELLKGLRAVRDDGPEYARASMALTDYIVHQAGSKRLAEMILSFNRQIARYLKLSLAVPERRKRSYLKWVELVTALTDSKADEAERIARQLATGTRDMAVEILSQPQSVSPAPRRRGDSDEAGRGR